MKAIFVLLVLVLLAATAYNIWQTHEMRRSVDELRTLVEQDRARAAENDQALSAVGRAISQAQDAIAHADWRNARTALERAETGLENLGRTIGQEAAPAVRRVREQAANLLQQVQAHLGSQDQKQAGQAGR
ncbi:MAG: hypothetical protein ACP5VE_05880 [Chthonomonadales bacterium]